MAPTHQRPKSLSNGRPKAIQSTSKPSSRNSRKLINDFHNVSKALSRAQKAGDDSYVESLQAQLDGLGGLQQYQQASKAGQSAQRGGDSSRVLMDWLRPCLDLRRSKVQSGHATPAKLRMLEVGALAVDNACSRSGAFDVTRIDLNSQDSQILRQDFMERPLPVNDAELFDCVSLSLVVNYCPDPVGRGEMLRRAIKFLSNPVPGSKEVIVGDKSPPCFPSVFLVLPAPCVTNSRYFDEARLEAIMNRLGCVQAFRKMSAKLVYYLWVLQSSPTHKMAFPKIELNPGKDRNNFAVVLE